MRSEERGRSGPGSRTQRISKTTCRGVVLLTLLGLSAISYGFVRLDKIFCTSCKSQNTELKLRYLLGGLGGSPGRLRLLEYSTHASSTSETGEPGSLAAHAVLPSDVTPPLRYILNNHGLQAKGDHRDRNSQQETSPPIAPLIDQQPDQGQTNHPANNAADTKQALPLVIIVTPTFNRPAQAVHITQKVNVLRVVPPPLLWIVVESFQQTEETRLLLERTAGRCIHVGRDPECTTIDYIHITSGVHHENHASSRGVNQRNAALAHIESNRIEGIVYFMDDDNSYSPQLFEEIRKVKKVGALPVGFIWTQEAQQVNPRRNFKPFVERPLVREGLRSKHVVGWETFEWAARMDPKVARKFQTDMAGFTFNSRLLWEATDRVTGRPRHPVRFKSRPAFIETMFLDRLISSLAELEPLADGCQDVLVWHTRMEAFYTDAYPDNWRLPQPTKLVPDIGLNHTARYVVKKQRMYLTDHRGGLPFGYKQMAKPEVKKPQRN